MNDKEFLCWIHARLEHHYGENPLVDYMHKLRAIIHHTPEDQCSPNVLIANSLEDIEACKTPSPKKMNRKDLIEAGIKMLKKSCDEVVSEKDMYGTTHWHGRIDHKGGFYTPISINQDSMTPSHVAHRLGHKRAKEDMKLIRLKAEEDCNRAAMRHYDIPWDE